MPEVHILGIVGLSVYLQGDIVSFCIVNFLVTALDIPDTPRSDNLHFGCKMLYCQLKTNLVVTLTGTTVADCVSPFLLCNFNYSLCNNGTCKRSTQKVFILVNRTCLHCRINIVFNKLFSQIFNVELGSTGLECLFFKSFKFAILTYVTGYCYNFAVIIVFLKPRNNDRRIKSTRVCKNNFLNFSFHLRLTLKK